MTRDCDEVRTDTDSEKLGSGEAYTFRWINTFYRCSIDPLSVYCAQHRERGSSYLGRRPLWAPSLRL